MFYSKLLVTTKTKDAKHKVSFLKTEIKKLHSKGLNSNLIDLSIEQNNIENTIFKINNPDYLYWLLKNDEEIISILISKKSSKGNDIEALQWVFTQEKYKGKGYISYLMNEYIKYCIIKKRKYIISGTTCNNEASINLHKKSGLMGFQKMKPQLVSVKNYNN